MLLHLAALAPAGSSSSGRRRRKAAAGLLFLTQEEALVAGAMAIAGVLLTLAGNLLV